MQKTKFLNNLMQTTFSWRHFLIIFFYFYSHLMEFSKSVSKSKTSLDWLRKRTISEGMEFNSEYFRKFEISENWVACLLCLKAILWRKYTSMRNLGWYTTDLIENPLFISASNDIFIENCFQKYLAWKLLLKSWCENNSK